MNTSTNTNNTTRVNLWIDLAIFTALLVAFQPHLTGLAIHEWLSLAFGGGALTHLVLHWRWVLNVARRFFQKLPAQTRLFAVLNVALLVALAGVIVSGVMLSEVALPALGITLAAGGAWHVIHSISANAIIALSVLHVVVHWKWILNAIKRYVVAPVGGYFNEPAQAPTVAAPARKSAGGFAGWAVSVASLAWLVGMFGGWLVAAVKNNSTTTDTSTSSTATTSTTSTASTVSTVQSFTARTRSSQ